MTAAIPARAQNTTAVEIAEAEAAWRAAGMSEYVMTLIVRCFCIGSQAPQTFHVKDGKVEMLSLADDRTGRRYESYNTVEKLFDALKRANERGA